MGNDLKADMIPCSHFFLKKFIGVLFFSNYQKITSSSIIFYFTLYSLFKAVLKLLMILV